MKTSVDWLNQYLDRPTDVDQAKRVLSDLGFPDDETLWLDLPNGDNVPCVDFEVTSNRGDVLSHVGLARELAAGTGRTLRMPDGLSASPATAKSGVDQWTSVTNEVPGLCPVYTARVLTGVKIGPSPAWLSNRLASIGVRPVNNVVDVTNFVLHELGQPLHAFDLAQLDDQRIVVRHAGEGETITTIDGSTHTLSPEMLVIADAASPQAIAGVMGGQGSEVSEQTSDLLLESAVFDPLSVRSTSRALKLASDSSYRFERRVDPCGVDRASRRAAEMIVDLAGGALAQGVIRVGQPEPSAQRLTMRVNRCNALLGLSLSGPDQTGLLDRLGLSPQLDGSESPDEPTIVVCVPPYRQDLRREVDLIEEVARLHGLNQVPVREKITLQVRPTQPAVRARRTIDRVLVAYGYHETITPSFVTQSQGQPFLDDQARAVMTTDDRSRAAPMLRPMTLPSLLSVRKFNQAMGNGQLKLYEQAACWQQRGEPNAALAQAVEETRLLTLLRDAEDASHALREIRGVIDELINSLSGPGSSERIQVEPSDLPNFAQAITLHMDNQAIASLGLVDSKTLKHFEVQTPQVAATLDFDALIDLYPPSRSAPSLPRYPGIERDLSIILDQAVTWRQIEQAVHNHWPTMLDTLDFVTTYHGKPIPKGRKSVTVSLLFRHPERTLTHEQVDPQIDQLVSALRVDLGAELRE